MINEIFLRQSVADLHKGLNVYIYKDKFIDEIAKEYYKKYDDMLYIQPSNGYNVLTTRKISTNKRSIVQYEIYKENLGL